MRIPYLIMTSPWLISNCWIFLLLVRNAQYLLTLSIQNLQDIIYKGFIQLLQRFSSVNQTVKSQLVQTDADLQLRNRSVLFWCQFLWFLMISLWNSFCLFTARMWFCTDRYSLLMTSSSPFVCVFSFDFLLASDEIKHNSRRKSHLKISIE